MDGCAKGTIDKIKVQQNNAARAVLKADSRTSCVKLYQESDIDPVEVSMKKMIVKIVYKGLNDIGAPVYNDMFNYETYSQELRNSDKLIAEIPRTNTKFGEHNVAFRGPTYWNLLPLSLKSLTSFDSKLQ